MPSPIGHSNCKLLHGVRSGNDHYHTSKRIAELRVSDRLFVRPAGKLKISGPVKSGRRLRKKLCGFFRIFSLYYQTDLLLCSNIGTIFILPDLPLFSLSTGGLYFSLK